MSFFCAQNNNNPNERNRVILFYLGKVNHLKHTHKKTVNNTTYLQPASHRPGLYVELICEEELLLPELLVFCPLVALGCRCTRWLEASLLFSLWLAPALLRTAGHSKKTQCQRNVKFIQTDVSNATNIGETKIWNGTTVRKRWKRANAIHVQRLFTVSL